MSRRGRGKTRPRKHGYRDPPGRLRRASNSATGNQWQITLHAETAAEGPAGQQTGSMLCRHGLEGSAATGERTAGSPTVDTSPCVTRRSVVAPLLTHAVDAFASVALSGRALRTVRLLAATAGLVVGSAALSYGFAERALALATVTLGVIILVHLFLDLLVQHRPGRSAHPRLGKY